MAKGKYLAFLDQDDCMFSTSLITRLSVAEELKSDMLFTSYVPRTMSAGGIELGIHAPRRLACCKNAHPPFNKELLLQEVETRNITHPSVVMVRRDTFIKCGGCEPGLIVDDDRLLWRRILELDDSIVSYIDEPTAYVSKMAMGENQSVLRRMPSRDGFELNETDIAGACGQYLDAQARIRGRVWSSNRS